MKVSELEERLLRGEVGELCRAALIASGVATQPEMDSYLGRLDRLWRSIPPETFAPESKLEMAQRLFQWLWQRKPARYRSGGNFKLTEVLEAELDSTSQAVGNCLGLTLLYHVLLERLGLQPRAVHLDHAFGIGPHVFTALRFEGRCPELVEECRPSTGSGGHPELAEGRSIDIENIFPYGFDYKGHLGHPQRKEWDARQLVADIYASRGNQCFEMGKLEAAVDLYEKAMGLNPTHPTAALNRAVALAELGRGGEVGETVAEEGRP